MAFTLQAVVALDGSKFTGGLTGMMASVQKFAGMSMTMFGGVAGQVAAMWASFGPMGGVLAGLQSIVKVGATFENSMKAVQSVTGLVGDEMDRVSKATREAAAVTSFTAAQAGEAMYALGAAGMNSADMLEATLLPSLKLAAATQSETRLATETMTAALAVWQKGASEAAGVADLFAGSIASSPLTMERLADAMKYAGPAGAAFKMSLKETVDTVAAFHQVGLRGQMAGTAFRMALIKLSEAAQKGSGQVGSAMKGWSAETEGLRGAVERLTAAGVPAGQVIQELGARAGPGVASLMKLGSAAMGELSDRITENSNVTKMYDIQMSGLMGQFQLFKAQVEEVAQKVFTKLAPALTSTLTVIRNLVDKIPILVGAFRSVMDSIHGIVSTNIPPVIGWFNTLTDSGKFLRAGLAALGAGIGLLGPVFLALAKMVAVACVSMLKSLMAFLIPALTGIAAVTAAFAAFSFGETISRVRMDGSTLGAILTEKITGIIIEAEYFAKEFPLHFKSAVLNAVAFVLEQAPKLAEAFGRMIAPIVEKFGEFRAWILETLNFDEAAARVRKNSKEMADSLRNIEAPAALRNIRERLRDIADDLSDLADEKLYRLETAFVMAGDEAAKAFDEGIDRTDVFSTWLQTMETHAGEAWQALSSGGAKALAIFNRLIGPVEKSAAALRNAASNAKMLPPVLEDAGDGLDDFEGATEPAVESLAKFGDEVLRIGKALAGMKKEKLEAIWKALEDFAIKLSRLPKINLSWVRDLGELKLPPLGRVRFWVDNFKELIKGIKSAGGLEIDMGWTRDLSELKLPNLGNVRFWKDNFEDFIDAISGANGLNLSFTWAADLGKLRLPHIGNVDSWKTGFDKLTTALSNVPAIDLTWMDSITNFKMPETEFWGAFGTTFAEFADTINKAPKPDLSWIKSFSIIDTVDVEKIKAIASAMQGLPTGTYNASVMIGWEANARLDSIDGHLATLCGMKGVIWA